MLISTFRAIYSLREACGGFMMDEVHSMEGLQAQRQTNLYRIYPSEAWHLEQRIQLCCDLVAGDEPWHHAWHWDTAGLFWRGDGALWDDHQFSLGRSRMKEWIEWAWIDRTSSYTHPHFLPWQLCCPWHSMTSKPRISRSGFGIFPAQAKHIPSKGECVKVIGQAYADRPTGAINTEKHHQPLHMGVSENSVPLIPMVNDHYPY